MKKIKDLVLPAIAKGLARRHRHILPIPAASSPSYSPQPETQDRRTPQAIFVFKINPTPQPVFWKSPNLNFSFLPPPFL